MIQIKDCACGKRCENANSEECASCAAARRKIERNSAKQSDPFRSIRQFSTERTRLEHKYSYARKKFLAGKKCAAKFPHNCPIDKDLTVHHMAGRIGYHDEWARENDVTLLLDERLWLPLCLEAHKYIEENKKWACENGYSFLRVSDPIFQKKDSIKRTI